MATKKEFSKIDYAEASVLFEMARKQVHNRTQASNAIPQLAKSIAKLKENALGSVKGNLTKVKSKSDKAIAKVKNEGNKVIAGYREKILATIKDEQLKEKIRQLSFPKL